MSHAHERELKEKASSQVVAKVGETNGETNANVEQRRRRRSRRRRRVRVAKVNRERYARQRRL